MSAAAKLKVLYVLDAFPDPLAGTEGQFWLLFRGLDRSRFEPGILLLQPSEFLQTHITDAPLRVLGVQRLRSLATLRKVLGAARWARRAGYRIAHIFFNDSTIVFPLPLRLAGLRVIVSRRDLGFWYTRGNLPVLRAMRHFVDRAIANCRSVKAAVCSAERFAPERVEVIYNAWQARSAKTPERAAARAALGLSADSQVIALVANLRPLKRVEDAIRAFALVARQVPGAHLLIVGEDRKNADGTSMRENLEKLCAAERLDGVRFLGKLADPSQAIAAADVCLLCSETEGLSNSVLEYMSLARPVVCTDVGGNAELIENGINGYCVRVGDVAAMADRLRGLLQAPDLARRMGAESARRVRERFSLESYLDAHVALYSRLAQVREPGHH